MIEVQYLHTDRHVMYIYIMRTLISKLVDTYTTFYEGAKSRGKEC